MRLNRRRRRHETTMDMTPMIDIVFQLLIFFLTVNQVAHVSNEPLELPRLQGSQDSSGATLTVNINAAEELIVTGARRTLGEVSQLVAGLVTQYDRDPSRVVVVLRVDRRAASHSVNQLVEQLKTLGISRIRIGVEVPS